MGQSDPVFPDDSRILRRTWKHLEISISLSTKWRRSDFITIVTKINTLLLLLSNLRLILLFCITIAFKVKMNSSILYYYF